MKREEAKRRECVTMRRVVAISNTERLLKEICLGQKLIAGLMLSGIYRGENPNPNIYCGYCLLTKRIIYWLREDKATLCHLAWGV